jgi:hypothetical protein
MSNATANAFKFALTRKGLLNPLAGTALVHGIDGEDRLLAKWQAVANRFVHKGHKVRVLMGVERLYFNESRVWPIVEVKS